MKMKDAVSNCKMLSILLKRKGIECNIAYDGAEAVAAYKVDKTKEETFHLSFQLSLDHVQLLLFLSCLPTSSSQSMGISPPHSSS